MLDDGLKAELKEELDVALKEFLYVYFVCCPTRLTELKDKLWKMLND
jgi:hypothetical protein